VVDPPDLLLGEPDRDELREPAALPDHAHRAVLRVHERHRRLDDAPQYHLDVEVRADGDDGVEQSVHPVPGGHDRLQPDLQLRQQLVQAQTGQDRPGGAGFHYVLRY
jgi:hypothetical protein